MGLSDEEKREIRALGVAASIKAAEDFGDCMCRLLADAASLESVDERDRNGGIVAALGAMEGYYILAQIGLTYDALNQFKVTPTQAISWLEKVIGGGLLHKLSEADPEHVYTLVKREKGTPA